MSRADRGLVIAAPRPYHGLGNRVRVVLGARSLARHVDRDFAYAWPLGSRFGARFDELWDIRDRRISSLSSRVRALRHPYRGEDLAWMADAVDERVWQIRTAHALRLPEGATPWGEELQTLRPVDTLAERISSFHAAHFGDVPYVGVMVRTHPISNQQTLLHSPIEWYLERMHEIRDRRPDVRFFVSADTVEGQTRITADVPNAFALPDKGEYNSKAALLSSVVDLYLLAGSGHILAPHYSSFPEISQKLAGTRLRLETSQSPDQTKWREGDGLSAVRDPLRPFEPLPPS